MKRFISFFATLVFMLIGFVMGGLMTTTAVRAPGSGATGDASWIPVANFTPQEQVVRDSSVKITQPGGYGSGNYFKWKGFYIVVTAAHVVQNLTSATVSELDGGEVEAKVMYRDDVNDVAVLLLPHPLRTRNPLKLKIHEPKNLLGMKVFYTGNPNFNSLMSLDGRVASFGPLGRYYMQGFAWFGSSGSCVFDRKGRFVAIVTAMDHYMEGKDMHPLENLVLIIPASTLSLDLLQTALEDNSPAYFLAPKSYLISEEPEEAEEIEVTPGGKDSGLE